MEIIWGFIVGYAITWLIVKLLTGYLRAKNAQLQDQLKDLDKKVKELFVRVTIEKHGDIYYIFDKDTDNFIAQGKDADEIKRVMQQRFPNKTFIATDDEINKTGLTL